MFKVLIIQKFYGLLYEQTEYHIKDSLSFQKFLGLTLSDDVPDEKTIWHFRERLISSGVIEKLFHLFNEYLEKEGIIGNEGIIIDATLYYRITRYLRMFIIRKRLVLYSQMMIAENMPRQTVPMPISQNLKNTI